MFSRHRHRSYSNPPKNTTPNSNAALAASQAFLKDRASNASLSNAAATAALRSFTTSPTAVADIQTKRMIRRGSTSSQGSADARGQSNRGLVRQSSSGSMTERTFRSPSPNRKGSPSIDPNAPPVPAIPKNVPKPPFRVTSPGPKKQGGRGVSVDRGTIQMHAARVTNLSQVPEVDRENSQRSINFSRPISPQSSSPSPRCPISHLGQVRRVLRNLMGVS
ncbi:hypothetical protein M501DRAFT_1009143 [Patellaria atrata CBS 101060]|uniref:Uncharacterized protein n=1 Tax=Patellaria atrata CBS 101060 TaxID=1346257 RepID=A0A9P4VT53_9PEZI|nr:hypothetical protein M501DRAFT_1009143 [Patellaria atrata CBS 101060]